MLEHRIPLHIEPMLVKTYVRRCLGLSLTQWRKIKQAGFFINGQPAAPHHQLQPGDLLLLQWETACDIEPTPIPLSIIYEDDYLLIIDKPAGLVVHPVAGNRTHTLANAVIYYYRQHSLAHAFHPVHRLDRNTSGLIVIAKYPHIQHQLSQGGFQLERRYLAISSGQPPATDGLIDAPIDRLPGSIILRQVAASGQPAQTNYHICATAPSGALLELTLLTGRTHQIRVHLAYIGCPLHGDDLYGGPLTHITRQALHSAYLAFTHPVSKEKLTFSAPLPPDMQYVWHTLQHQTTK